MPYFHYEFDVFVGCSKCKQSLLDFAKNKSLAEKQKGFYPKAMVLLRSKNVMIKDKNFNQKRKVLSRGRSLV
jgi:hypothetical protein